MKAIKINAKDRKIEEIEISTWKDISPAIGCDLFTTMCMGRSSTSDRLYIDDEGMINGTQDFFYLEGMPQPYAGNGVILGTDREGESIEPKTKIEDLKITFFTRQEVALLCRQGKFDF